MENEVQNDTLLGPEIAALRSGSVNLRTDALKKIRQAILETTDLASSSTILLPLLSTFPRYHDRKSRNGVQDCLLAFIHNKTLPEPAIKTIVTFLSTESQRVVIAPTNALVLLEWCSLVQQQWRIGPGELSLSLGSLCLSAAATLEKCLHEDVRGGLRQSALVVSRRGVSSLLKSGLTDFSWLETMLTALTSTPTARPTYCPYIGIIAEVCSRSEPHRLAFNSHAQPILSFYARCIIGSNTPIPAHIAGGLNSFFYSFKNSDMISTELAPPFEKAILRFPEIILQGLIPAFVQSLPSGIELPGFVHSHLLQPLISAMKSTNAGIREGAATALSSLLSKCSELQARGRIAEDILSALKAVKTTNNEFRALLASCLASIPPGPEASFIIVEGLSAVAAKESNEAVMKSLVLGFCCHLQQVLEGLRPLGNSVRDTVSKACADKRINFRKAWLLGLGTSLRNLDNVPPLDENKDFILTVLKLQRTALDEVAPNVMPAVQTGFISTGYVLIALLDSVLLRCDPSLSKQIPNLIEQSLVTKPKLSFLLNPRVYSRLSDVEDLQWALHALICVAPELANCEQSTAGAWAQAMLYLLSSPDVSPKVRKAAGSDLSKAFLKNPSTIGYSIVLGIWEWLQAISSADKDSAAMLSKAGTTQLQTGIMYISPPRRVWEANHLSFPEAVLEKQAVSTTILCRPQLIPGSDWIDMCLRIGIDPGKVTHANRKEILDHILSKFPPINVTGQTNVEKAACDAVASMAFVDPDGSTPLVVAQIIADLQISQFENIGPTEIAISRTPVGVVFVDVLSQKTDNLQENKNIKDYDVLKWEEQVRAQLAQKKGPQKKLTAEQQAKIDAQLSTEAAIRLNVQKVARNVRRGAGFVYALATGPPTDARTWISPAIMSLLAAFQAGAALLVNAEMVTAFLTCSNQVAARLGTFRESIGVATLRAVGNVPLPERYEDEPLGELATRVLYRLRFAAEQRPFDSASLVYMLPLVFHVLEHGAIGFPSGEDADAQILLALEFLGFHMSSCSDMSLPRLAILTKLVAAMRRYTQHYRVLKDALLDFCISISSNIQREERDALLKCLALPEVGVRSAVLQAIHSELDLSEMESSEFLWLACHDEDEDNAATAEAIWEESAMSIEDVLVNSSLPFLNSTNRSIRRAAGKALTEAVIANPSTLEGTIEMLQTSYLQDARPPAPKRDKFGLIQKTDLRDKWEKRSGVAIAFKCITPALSASSLVPFMEFLITKGPLSDRNAAVRNEMVEAGTTLVAVRGQECLEPLMKFFEEILERPDQGTQEGDWTNEAAILLYGSLARHLSSGDARVRTVVLKLIATLSTPSETVQYAVAGCLAPLVRLVESDTGTYISQLMDQLFQSKSYAARRGAAYGIAGIVSGKGISALRQFRIMSSLRGATENKKSVEQRQGALFAYELLSLILGRTFEPYVVEILPQLLGCFGDPVTSVREACLDTAKTCFASLSSFGVHQVLPRLLEGLDETQWRSKKGACDLLGAMAYLDPQQLASSLPDIIPPLTAVLTDTHKEVRAAANNSLQRFGEVISNPEVKSLVSILLKALSDPTKYTEDALDGLIRVSFVHYLDAPSLALVVRILERGLADRSSTKRKAAQIIGSLAHLTERRDLSTHLPILVSGLREAAVDPVPATRATASKALGSLVEKLGEDALPDLIPSLMASLRTDTGAGDRLGSAQALSEVLAGLGTSRLEDTLPTILQNVSSTRATVREGFMTLFIFLPACFGNSFAAYLSQIIPSILGGLADDLEAIREISLRAGRLLVKNFATKAIDLLLPELQRGLADDNYRIRLSSVELVGDLLFNLTGVTSKGEDDEEEENAAQAGQSLLDVLGEERRNKVLSSLYICRCDTSGLVRSAAIAVWKALVATPRTLRELVPTLTQMIIARLASSNMEQKVIAGNALGEVIRKAGEGVLTTLLPALEEGLRTSTDADNRQGICIALREIVSAAQPETLEDYEKKLISIVRIALVDSDEDVRDAAAESFDALQQIFGKRAVDQVLPNLLNLLRDESEAENALAALLTLLTETTRANVILPNLIPTLLTNPITAFNARALASLAKVGSSSMTRRLPIVLNTLSDNIVACKDDDLRIDLDAAFDAVLASVDEFDGLNTAMSVMLAMIKHDDHRKRAVAASHLATFFSSSVVDYSRYNQDLIRVLLISFDDRDREVVKASWSALSQLQAHLRKEEMESLVNSTRQVLLQVGVAGSILPGFALPKGILPVLQIFLQGLMNGTAEQRVQAALGISDIIDRSSADSLKPFVTQITGPLIRVVGERSVDVKCAILFTLSQLLEKIPTFLRPFLPQLQRTFTKSIADPTSDLLRTRATKALSTLITLTPRVDPLIAELVTGAKMPDAGVRNAMLKALQEVVSKVGSNMSESSRESILMLIDSQQELGRDDNMTVTHSRLLGAMIKVLPASSAASLIKSRVINLPSTNASILTLNSVLFEAPESLTTTYIAETRSVICHGLSSKYTFIQQNAVLASGKLLMAAGVTEDEPTTQMILESLAGVIQPGTDIDSRRLALVVVRTISRHHPEATAQHLGALAPSVFASVRDPVIPVKLAAEAAFLQLFSVVDSEATVFDQYLAGPGKALAPGPQRSMSDYFKRVALRLGAQARERREAEGGQGGLGLASDEAEDEREVWSVGKVELGNDLFVQD